MSVLCRGTCDATRYVRKAGASFPGQVVEPQEVALQGLSRDPRAPGGNRLQAMEFERPKFPS